MVEANPQLVYKITQRAIDLAMTLKDRYPEWAEWQEERLTDILDSLEIPPEDIPDQDSGR